MNRDKREKVQLLHAEKKLKTDIEEMKIQMRRIVVIFKIYLNIRYEKLF